MEHVEYVYTTGMTESELEERLESGEHGVLALADDNDAYAVPLSYHYAGDQLLLRVSSHDGEAEKRRYLKNTDVATFVCYEASTKGSWSIHVRGEIREWEEEVDDTTLNEWFPPFRLFDEAVEEVEFSLYQLEMSSVTGRTTSEY